MNFINIDSNTPTVFCGMQRFGPFQHDNQNLECRYQTDYWSNNLMS